MTYNAGWDHSTAGHKTLANHNTNTTTRPINFRGPLPQSGDLDKINTHQAFDLAFGVTQNSPSIKVGAGAVMCAMAGSVCETATNCTGVAPASCTNTIKTASTPGAFAINNSNTGPGNVTFTIGASGDVDGSQNDEWTMNENKVLTNTQDGTQ